MIITVVEFYLLYFRNNSLVLGDEGGGRLCNAIILSVKEEPQLQVWLDTFISDYRNEERVYNAIEVSKVKISI